MSEVAEAWARTVDAGSPAGERVLRALAERADDECRCSARPEDIAGAAAMGVRSVRRHVKILETAGLVERRMRQRADGRGRDPDLLFLAVPPAFRVNGSPRPTGQIAGPPGQIAGPPGQPPGQMASWSADSDLAFQDLTNNQYPPLGSPPGPLGRGRWKPQQVPLDALPGPLVCDDWEQARQHPECKRVAGLVLDHASRRDTNPLTGPERNRLYPHVVEWLQAGWAPEAVADAAAHAPAKTEPSVGFELRKRARPRSVGTDGVDVARRWIAGGSA